MIAIEPSAPQAARLRQSQPIAANSVSRTVLASTSPVLVCQDTSVKHPNLTGTRLFASLNVQSIGDDHGK